MCSFFAGSKFRTKVADDLEVEVHGTIDESGGAHARIHELHGPRQVPGGCHLKTVDVTGVQESDHIRAVRVNAGKK